MAGRVAAETLAALDARVEARFEDGQLPFLLRLAAQPSCSREPADVEAAACLLDEAAQGLDLVRTLHPVASGRYATHRVYETPAARAGGRGLSLIGHVDTVFPRDSGLGPVVRQGDVVRGPGVLDMKSGLSVVLYALDALRTVSPACYEALCARFVVTTDEELGSPSSHALVEGLAATSHAALVFEAGRAGDLVVTRRKGTGLFHARALGVAAHAGNHHEDGVSAIHALSILVGRLEAITDYGRGVTVNVGLFEGGVSKNTVPAEAKLVADVRFAHDEDGTRLVEAMSRAVTEPLPRRLRRARLELRGGIVRPPMEASEAQRALRIAYEAHAAAVGLGVGEAPLQGGGSDANFLSAAGVPCIDGLGPYGAGAHGRDEWCSVPSLRARTRALARFLASEGTAARASAPLESCR